MELIAVLRWCLLFSCLALTASQSQPEKCSSDAWLDVVFVVATTGNVGASNYNLYYDFIAKVMDKFSISNKVVRVGIVGYAPVYSHYMVLLGDRKAIDKYIKIFEAQNGTLDMKYGLATAFNLLYFGKRPNAHCVIIFLTDTSYSTPDLLIGNAHLIKYDDMNIFTVGVKPGANTTMLQGMATKPEYSFEVDSYAAMVDKSDVISKLVCNLTQCVPIVPIDVYFTVDSKRENFQSSLDVIRTIVNTLNVTSEGVRVGFISYNITANFVPVGDKEKAFQMLNDSNYVDREQPDGLYYPLELANSIVSYYHQGRRNSRRVIVYLSDAKSVNFEQDRSFVDTAKAAATVVFAYGVTQDADQDELNKLVSKPEYNLSSGNVNIVGEVLATLKERGCKASS